MLTHSSTGFPQHKNHKYFIKIKNENLSLPPTPPGNLCPSHFTNYFNHAGSTHHKPISCGSHGSACYRRHWDGKWWGTTQWLT